MKKKKIKKSANILYKLYKSMLILKINISTLKYATLFSAQLLQL